MPRRMPLGGRWSIAPGTAGHDEPPADSTWTDIDEPMPVAAALASQGRWSLDGPARDFDAECWWYRCRFDAAAAEFAGAGTVGFDGLATLATVWLNGRRVLESRNMFRAHEVGVEAGALAAHGNELLIRFDPLAQALARKRPRPRWRAPMLAQQQLRWWRTTLLGRTPGWSPPAVVVGPWRKVWWAPADDPRPVEVRCRPSLAGKVGELVVSCRFTAEGARDVQVELEAGGQRHRQLLVETDGTWQGVLRAEGIEPWWPATHGRPARHPARLHWRGADGEVEGLDLGQMGFCRIEADTSGGGFGLRVNGEPVFARGACWVPLDTLRLHVGPGRYREVLARLRDAGFNLLRVGGTMAYEAPAFFEACDELGLMVWQDLMFANMDYPGDDAEFMQEARAELATQLPAWSRHACLAVVCGNSEVEQQAAMWGAGREHWQPPLFHEWAAGEVAAALPGVVWWPSSAHGGAFPFQPNGGTTSYYGVGAYRRPVSDARASGLRFATECLAFAQVPPDATLSRMRALNADLPPRPPQPLWKARAPRDLTAGWDFDDVRDHYVGALFGEDAQVLRMSDPARHLVLGRAAVSEAIVAAFSQWRAEGSPCRGALVWFLRDLWAGAGWGYLDDQCQPKAVFHALARVCQPLHLGVTDDGLNGLGLHLAHERPEAREGRGGVVLYREGEWPVASAWRDMRLLPHSLQSWALVEWLDGFTDASWAYRFGPPPADVLVFHWEDSTGRVERVHFIDAVGGPLRRSDVGLSAVAEPVDGGEAIEVTVRCRAAARAVHFEVDGWAPEDEYFHLPPDGERRLRFRPWAGAPRRPWRATVSAINALAPVTISLQPGPAPSPFSA